MLTDKNVELDYAKGRSRKKLQLIKAVTYLMTKYLTNEKAIR